MCNENFLSDIYNWLVPEIKTIFKNVSATKDGLGGLSSLSYLILSSNKLTT